MNQLLPPRQGDAAARWSGLTRGAMAALLLALAALFLALGVWQVERRASKLRLIAAVDRRVHAPPAPAPGPSAWPAISADSAAYTHVRAHGMLLEGRDTLVQAVTERGAGYWLLTPLRTDAGWTLLVNRGFVPAGRGTHASRRAGEPTGPVTITGLLRITEPGGGFLRRNDPLADRWYSRDVAAIARARHLGTVAPYFVDADAAPRRRGDLGGGLTVIAFHNNHLVYAITWFALAALGIAGLFALRTERIAPDKA